MKKSELLRLLNEKLSIISTWQPEYYEQLLKLSPYDIMNDTEIAINLTPALEYIFECYEIEITLNSWEESILKAIGEEYDQDKLNKVLEIISLCSSYTDILEIEEIEHPVRNYYNAKVLMIYTSEEYYTKLIAFYEKYPTLINYGHYEIATTASILPFGDVELCRLFQNGTVEEIINYLKTYIIYKNQDTSCENVSKSYINSEIMKKLYDYSSQYINEDNIAVTQDDYIFVDDELSLSQEDIILAQLDDSFLKSYQKLEDSYLEAKRYQLIYKNSIFELKSYAQKCKKL